MGVVYLDEVWGMGMLFTKTLVYDAAMKLEDIDLG